MYIESFSAAGIMYIEFFSAAGIKNTSQEWMEGIIVRLQKGGHETDIRNYRALTLGSHTGSIFGQVLYVRLSAAVEGKKILGEAQGWFRKGTQAVDQLLVVNVVIHPRRSRGKKTWLVFLVLKKAFPSEWREGLFVRR